MTVYAKSNPPETIETHNQNLLICYESLKPFLDPEKVEKYDAIIKKIIYYHDLGKLNHKFQDMILKKLGLKNKHFIPELKDTPNIPHEWLSIAFITMEDKRYFHSFDYGDIKFHKLIQYCVAFHHTRKDNFNKKAVEEVVKHDLEKNKHRLGITSPLNTNYDIEKDLRQSIDTQAYYKYYFELLVFFKGILHKCDYTASAGIDPERPYQGIYSSDFEGWLRRKGWSLKLFQAEAKDLANKNVILVAATGSGKTEYSMNWINGGKAFYLLGLRMAVNEMYKRFNDVFGDNVSLLHGDIVYLLEDDETTETYTERIESARKLCAPLTVATADQLVTAAFKYNGFELVYLTASYSKIVVDEIQSFSPDSIAAIVVFLKEIHRLGGKFLLMTATLPPFIKKELQSLDNVEIPTSVLSDARRHKIAVHSDEICSPGSLKIIIGNLESGKKVLIVCNTVKRAQEMYEALKHRETSLLHSRFIQRDRKYKEAAIMAINDPMHLPVIWIATQVVEASLDLDFDVLFTESSPVDSLFQRFGRCYRKREYELDPPNIHIFYAKPFRGYDNILMKRTYDYLRDHYDGLFMTECDKQKAIEYIFHDIESTNYYIKYKNYKDLLELGFKAESKPQAQDMFRNIAFNYCVIPRPVYDKHEKEITEALGIIEAKGTQLHDKLHAKAGLRQYTVAVQLFDSGRLMTVANSPYCKRNAIYIIKDVAYSFEKGIELNETMGAGVFID
ncbi:MAG: CRISPR-associated helicase Cas3' [Nitrospirae bacterium]|nr:CRISPR-associated helicase Cas3' [Nitrospirota bacterium]